MEFRKLIGKVHLWLGLSTGLIVFIIAISGSVYVFVDEIKPIVYGRKMFVQVPDHNIRMSADRLREIAQTALGEKFPLQSIEVHNAPNRAVIFRARKLNKTQFLHSNFVEYFFRVHVNPYTGEVIEVEDCKWEFFYVVINLHKNLLLGPQIGGTVVSYTVVFFVVLLISGLALWWPVGKISISKKMRFSWKDSFSWKRKNYDLHSILGFYVFLMGLTISLTGLVWAFDGFDEGVQWLANGGKTYDKPKTVFSDSTKREKMTCDSILLSSIKLFPSATDYTLTFASKPAQTANVSVGYSHNYLTTTIKFDQFSGVPLQSSAFSQKNAGEKLHALNFDIHTGALLNLPGKVFVFLSALVIASLPVSGFFIWLGRKGAKNKR